MIEKILSSIDFWIIVGFFGQFLFFMRFFTQWIYSERRKESLFPIYFWYFSIGGAIVILIYAIHIKDPVFITGQGLAMIIYIRNLVLIKRRQKIPTTNNKKND